MRFRAVVACAVSLAFCVTVVIGSAPAEAFTKSTVAAASPQQLFEGVFFGEGQIGQKLPEIWNADSRAAFFHGTSPNAPAFKNAVHQLEAEIAKTDPSYFQAFAGELTSGDPGLVRSALQRTGVEVRAIQAKYSAAPKQLALVHLPNSTLNVSVFTNVNYVGQALALIVGIVIYALAVFTVVIPVSESRDAHGIASLDAPKYVDDNAIALITSRLDRAQAG